MNYYKRRNAPKVSPKLAFGLRKSMHFKTLI